MVLINNKRPEIKKTIERILKLSAFRSIGIFEMMLVKIRGITTMTAVGSDRIDAIWCSMSLVIFKYLYS